jgi:hypothetical protein
MVSTEVMCAGTRVPVGFLLSEISTLLEKKEKKKRSVCVKNWIRKRNQLGASSMPSYEAVALIRYRIP